MNAQFLTWLLLSAAIAAVDEPNQTGAPVLVSPVSGYARAFKVVATRWDPATKNVEVTVEGEDGIFSFNFAPPRTEVTKVTFVVLKVKACEGFTFWPKLGEPAHLREKEGFAVKRRGEDLVVEITGSALNILVRGGRVQFVDMYR
jgi:hypothetical protein